MSLPTVTVFADDADAYVDRQVTDAGGNPLTFAPQVAIGAGPYDLTGIWQGDPAPTRILRVPVSSLDVGTHRLYLSIPGSNDLDLGYVNVVERK